MTRKLLVVLISLSLAGCTMGPNYRRPAVALPDQFHGASPAATPENIADRKWSELFQDEVLQKLVTTALEQNFDLRIAAERVLEARAQAGITRSELFPTLDAQAQFDLNRVSSIGSSRFLPRGTNLDASYTQAVLPLSWEIDLWGRIRRLTEAARAQYLASDQARQGVRLSIISGVMNTYFTLRELDLELEISKRTKDIAADNLRLINLRHDRGAANGLEVRQAEQFLYTATSQMAAVQRAIGQTEDALSLLMGNVPGAIPRGKALESITAPAQLPAGLPSTLLERRPDIRQSEDYLIAANAQIGAARSLYFPQLSLTGFLGGQSRALSQLFTGPARMANLAPELTLPIFRAGLRSGVQLTEAQKREALVSYQGTIYGALREVSDALVAHDQTREQRQQQEKLVAALSESVRLSTLRYRGGLDSYLQVLDAERNLFGGQLTLAQLRLTELQSVVQLYRALGGGWQ